ncbi:hypothetical protein, partial [Enterobacter cloacae complex sp. 2DZ2F20B]|uniref:hypothetical protein n=1 Tax=Enterobacter cloacae complex sp. 2DZ2F20B TaxID=2511993 RepID=UPI001CA5EC06
MVIVNAILYPVGMKNAERPFRTVKKPLIVLNVTPLWKISLSSNVIEQNPVMLLRRAKKSHGVNM